MKKSIFTIAFIFIVINLSYAQTWDEIAKSLPTPYAQDFDSQYYGNSVSIDGNYAVIGAYGYENNKGAAFVLFYDGSNWITQAQLMASDGVFSDSFGWSVSISGDNIVIGAYNDADNGGSSGSAYVFSKPGASWSNMIQTAKLLPSDGVSGDNFGWSVSISGDNIVVGARYDNDNGTYSGSAYVFTKPGAAWSNMSQTAKILPSDGAVKNYFGNSVSISGDNIVVGAQGDGAAGTDVGFSYVFTKPVGGWSNMTQTAKLIASDGAASDYFGQSVSISGDNVVVGASGDDDNGSRSGSAYVFTKSGGGWSNMTQTAKLLPSDGAINDVFGQSVSISGDNIVVGASGDDDNGLNSGSAYVYVRPVSGWISINQTAKLTSSDGAVGDYYGQSVSISGDDILVGASYDDDNGDDSGSAYIFTKPGGGWVNTTETEKVLPLQYYANTNNYYGISVSVDGSYAVVGSYGYETYQGTAYVLFYDGSNWITQAQLTASDGATSDQFGWSVSISGDNIVVGAYGDDDNGFSSGSAYVYAKPGASWSSMTETAKLLPSDGVADDYFGYSVCISGDNIVVGAYKDDDFGSNSGSAYVFTKPGANWSTMTETAKLTASDGAAEDKFGWSVSISVDNIVVGAYEDDDNGISSGSAYVFTKPGATWINMVQTAKIKPSDGAAFDNFGQSVGISGDNIVVGSMGDDDNGGNSGSAYVFTKPGASWSNITETAKLLPSDGAANDFFGYSVSISGENIVVGANYDDDNGGNSGSAYVYTKPGVNWIAMSETAKLLPSDGATNDFFAYSLSISGDNIAVGAYMNDDNGNGSGSAYLYEYCAASSASISPTACSSYISPSGNVWTTSNTYMDTIANINGCDSIITINLTVNLPVSNTTNTNVCYDGSYTYADLTTVTNLAANESHISTLVGVAANGCDSVLTENLTILPQLTGTHNETVCFGGSITVNGNVYDASNLTGTEVFTVGVNNCDSTVNVSLTIDPQLTGTHTETVCFGGSIIVNGTTYDAANLSGTEVFTIGANNCDSTVNVTLIIEPAIDINVTTTSPSITANQTGATYRWLDCNNNNSVISGETGATYTATANGDYAVEITVGNCVDTSACVNITSIGINESTFFNNVSIYPNPNKGIVNIGLGSLKAVDVKVYNTNGQLVHQKTKINTPSYQFEITGAKGIYFVELNSEGEVKRFKVIKD